MSLHDVGALDLDFFRGKSISVEIADEDLSTDAGLLLFRQFDAIENFTADFASQLDDDRRDPDHSVLEMVRSRVFGIVAGYEDQNDHDVLRSDAIFKMIAGRLPSDDDLASQPTLSRFENSIKPAALLRLENWFLDRFVESFDEENPPSQITLDVDGFDDPTHGQQQLTFFHGFYKQYQYMVRVVTCAENDLVVLPVLLFGTADVGLGFSDDLVRIVQRLREKFPDVHIHLRADSGFARPALYETCERLELDYSIGLGMNPVIQRNSTELLEETVDLYEQTGQAQRRFTGFWYQAGSWQVPRWAVVKCEVTTVGINRRAIVTNRPGAKVLPGGAYDEYVERGESENRNKELKCELCADRLSDHRYMANCFRMFLHCLANNLLVSLRRKIASPPPEPPLEDGVPLEAQNRRARRSYFNQRRREDPLGEGHASTWRMHIIKVAARITTTARRIRVFLSGTWPFLDLYHRLGRAILEIK